MDFHSSKNLIVSYIFRSWNFQRFFLKPYFKAIMLGFLGLRSDSSARGYALRKTFYKRFIDVSLCLWQNGYYYRTLV